VPGEVDGDDPEALFPELGGDAVPGAMIRLDAVNEHGHAIAGSRVVHRQPHAPTVGPGAERSPHAAGAPRQLPSRAALIVRAILSVATSLMRVPSSSYSVSSTRAFWCASEMISPRS